MQHCRFAACHAWCTPLLLALPSPDACRCTVAAQGLSAEEIEEIKNGLKPLLKPGQKLTLEEVVSWWQGESCTVAGCPVLEGTWRLAAGSGDF